MESAGQLLLSVPPLQLPSSISSSSTTPAAAEITIPTTPCCFVGSQQSQSATETNRLNCLNTSIKTESPSFSSFMMMATKLEPEQEEQKSEEQPMEQTNTNPQQSQGSEEEETEQQKQHNFINTEAIKRDESEEMMMPSSAFHCPSATFFGIDGHGCQQQQQTATTMLAALAAAAKIVPSTANTSATTPSKPLPVVKPPGNAKEERPSLSYKDLIIEAIGSSPDKRLKLSEIYQVIKYLHPYYQRRADQWGWQNSIRHNLSLHDCFVKLPLKQTSANGVVGHFWTVIQRNYEDKPGCPTRRRSRATVIGNGKVKGPGNKRGCQAQGQRNGPASHRTVGNNSNMINGGPNKAKGLKGRQSVSSDSGVMSDDGGHSGNLSGNITPTAGGCTSVPASVLLQSCTPPTLGEQPQKFQPLQSPLALNSHQRPNSNSSATTATTSFLHLPQLPHQHEHQRQQQVFTPTSIGQSQHQQTNMLLTPLELVINGATTTRNRNLIQAPIQQQQQMQYSPLPGKTAPIQPIMLEQQLQQLLSMANFGPNQHQISPTSPSGAFQSTPESAPTLLQSSLSSSSSQHYPLIPQTVTTEMASNLSASSKMTMAPMADDGDLGLLSNLASQALAAVITPQSASIQPQQQNNNALAAVAAAAAAELQRLQLLQLYAQQHQKQLQQQLALFGQQNQQQFQEQGMRLDTGTIGVVSTAGHLSSPLSPSITTTAMQCEQLQAPSNAQQQDQSTTLLTQLLLARLLEQKQQQQPIIPALLPLQQQQNQPAKSTPPPPVSAPAIVHSPLSGALFQHQQQQQRLELEQTALLLEQYQQQQQQQQKQFLLLQQLQRQQQLEAQLQAVAVVTSQMNEGATTSSTGSDHQMHGGQPGEQELTVV